MMMIVMVLLVAVTIRPPRELPISSVMPITQLNRLRPRATFTCLRGVMAFIVVDIDIIFVLHRRRCEWSSNPSLYARPQRHRLTTSPVSVGAIIDRRSRDRRGGLMTVLSVFMRRRLERREWRVSVRMCWRPIHRLPLIVMRWPPLLDV